MRYLGLIFLLIPFLSWALDPNLIQIPAADTQTVVENLFSLLNGPVTPLNCQQEARPICSFARACEAIQVNSRSPYLYDNGRGGRLANPQIAAIAQLVQQCSQSRASMGGPIMGGGNPYFSMPSDENPMTKFSRANADFRRFLVSQPASVQADMNLVELAMADIQVEAAEAGTMFAVEAPEEQLEAGIARAGVTLPEELQEKWLELHNLTRLPMGGIGYGGGMQGEGYGHGGFNPPSEELNSNQANIPIGIQELLDDPFNNPISMWVGERRENAMRVFEARANEARSRSEAVRSRLVQLMQTRAAANPSQAEALNKMVSRINTISINIPIGGTFEAAQSCPSANAFYDPSKHKVVICPQLIGMPAEQLEFAIAHELSHAIDPCNSSFPLNQITGIPDTSYSILESGSNSLVTSSEFVDGVSYDENPFGEALVCLARGDSLRAPPVRAKHTRRIMREVRRRARDGMGDLEDINNARREANKIVHEHAGCDLLPGNTMQQEAFADWLAAEVSTNLEPGSNLLDLGAFMLRDCPMADNTARLLPVYNYLRTNNCLPMSEQENSGQLVYTERVQDILQLSQWEQMVNDPHPPSSDRMNRLLLQHPSIRAQIGCERAPSGRYCAP